MVAPLDISVLVSQLPHLQKVQNAEQFHPELMQTQLSRHALEKQIRDRDKVPRAERSESALKVKEDSQRRGQSDKHGAADTREQHDEEDDASNDHHPKPGQIIDISV